MLEVITGLLGSTGFGAIIGWVGGLANRYMDHKTRMLEIEVKKLDHVHDLAMRDKDLENLKVEIEGKVQVSTVEGETKVAEAGYAALGLSYAHDSGLKGTPRTDSFRSSVRPIITLLFMLLICYVNYRVWGVLEKAETLLTADQAFEILRWTLFEASVVIGWWFANRPSGDSGLKLSK